LESQFSEGLRVVGGYEVFPDAVADGGARNALVEHVEKMAAGLAD
jgi:hypothetical protein